MAKLFANAVDSVMHMWMRTFCAGGKKDENGIKNLPGVVGLHPKSPSSSFVAACVDDATGPVPHEEGWDGWPCCRATGGISRSCVWTFATSRAAVVEAIHNLMAVRRCPCCHRLTDWQPAAAYVPGSRCAQWLSVAERPVDPLQPCVSVGYLLPSSPGYWSERSW